MRRFQVSILNLMVVILVVAIVAAFVRVMPVLLLIALFPVGWVLPIAAIVAAVRWSRKTWSWPPTLGSSVIQYASVAIGYGYGLWIYRWVTEPIIFGLIPAALAVALIVFEGIRAAKLDGLADRWKTQWVCNGLAAYAIALTLVDPFVFRSPGDDGAVRILLLVPVLLAVGHLSRVRAWAGTTGAAIFLETCTALLAGNARRVGHGLGFLSWWVETR